MTQSKKDLAKIAEDASPRRHVEISPVKFKDTHLMNNKLPPAKILCEEWALGNCHSTHLSHFCSSTFWNQNESALSTHVLVALGWYIVMAMKFMHQLGEHLFS